MAANVSFQFIRNNNAKNVIMLIGSTRSFWKLTEKVLRMVATSFKTIDVRSPARERLKKEREREVRWSKREFLRSVITLICMSPAKKFFK